LRARFGTRLTVTNRARKSSSNVSRTSAGIRFTKSSNDGSAFESASSVGSDGAGFAPTGSPRSRESARKADSAASSGQFGALGSSEKGVAIGGGAVSAAVIVTGSETTVAGVAALKDTGLSGDAIRAAASRPSSSSISPFFFRRTEPLPFRRRAAQVP
jgi:hypothetical protein